MSERPTALAQPVRALAYVAGLDGIRAVAVLAVLLFHADLPWIPGGFLGVDVFFVLSGYLITTLLLRQLDRTARVGTARIDFRRFYAGRARRLLPALVVVLLGSAVLALTIAPDAAERLRGDLVASLTYTNNWWYAVNHLSYFEAVGRPPLLQHLWTLSIEEQFYLVWPVVALVLYRWGGRLRVGTFALAGSLTSAGLMAAMSITAGAPASGDVSRVYFGTDTHAMGMLLGAAFATLWRMGALPEHIRAVPKRVLVSVGTVGLVGLVACFTLFTSDTVWLYRGGFLVVSALTVMVIAAAVHPAVGFGALLGRQPLRYLGQRSYGLYLFHWPIYMVLRPGIDLDWTGWQVLALRLGATVVAAELSYRFIEMPIRRGGFGAFWARLRAWSSAAAWAMVSVVTAAVVAGAVLLGNALAAMPTAAALEGLTASSVGAGSLGEEAPIAPPTTLPPAPPPVGPPTTGTPVPPAVVDLTQGPVTAVGDSVLLGDQVLLQAVMPQATVDAAVGRQSGAIFSRIRQRLAAGRLAPTVIIHAGTNGVIVADQLNQVLTAIGPDRVVVLVTTHVPKSWQDSNNAILEAAARKFSNVRIVDWNVLSAGQRGYFAPDFIHMNRVGGTAYTTAIATALGGHPKQIAAGIAAGLRQLAS